MKQLTRMMLCSIFLAGAQVNLSAADEYDIDKEISNLRKELSEITSQRKKVKEDAKKDEKEFADYTIRTKKRFDMLHQEIDSIENVITTQTIANDSLASVVQSAKIAKQQVDLQQNDFRDKLVAGCDTYIGIIKTYPPMVSKQLGASIAFLRSELIAKEIDNSEGVQRFLQILKDIDEASAAIQLVQGVSPISEIRGTTYRIRIGLFYEAVVNLEGTSCAVWTGFDANGNEIWEKGSDNRVAEQLLKCVNVRDGKALPEFIQLPIAGNRMQGAKQQ